MNSCSTKKMHIDNTEGKIKNFPLISIVIPVYNTAKYLQRCMDSVLNQTYPAIEVVCVDDGSTDDSGIILDAYATKDRRVHVVHQKNQGHVFSRKLGASLTKGQYISYVDSDDEISLTRYEDLLEKGIRQNVDIILTDVIQIYNDGKRAEMKHSFREGIYSKKQIISDIMMNICDVNHFYKNNLLTYVCCAVFSNKLIKECNSCVSNDILFGEGLSWLYVCLLKAKSLYNANTGTYFYYKNIDSISHIGEKRISGKIERKKSSEALYKHFQKQIARTDLQDKDILKREIVLYLYHELMVSDYDFFVNSILTNHKVFPYDVAIDSRVIIYGAGSYGMQLYKYLKKLDNSHVVLWCDRAWKKFQDDGFAVKDPRCIMKVDFDYILMAIGLYDIAYIAAESLIKAGAPKEKIRFIDVKELSNERLEDFFMYDARI